MAQDVDGRRIAGRYELGVQLGEGGVGIVWRAEDTLLGRPVAIKEVELPPAVRDEQRAALRARVICEARAAARLSHPGAVTRFDVVQDSGQDYIVMELVEGPTLDQFVADRGPLEPRQAAVVGLRLLATLEAAHRAGIVHRDVKPSNVLVREDGTTKLTDFGTASLTGDPELTATGDRRLASLHGSRADQGVAGRAAHGSVGARRHPVFRGRGRAALQVGQGAVRGPERDRERPATAGAPARPDRARCRAVAQQGPGLPS